MPASVRRIEYFYTNLKDQPGEAYRLMSRLESIGIKFLAFSAMPIGPAQIQFALFVDDAARFAHTANQVGLELDGPHQALLVRGDDQLSELAAIHLKLYEANVNVYASTGIADEKGSYGYIIYVKPEDFDQSCKALGV